MIRYFSFRSFYGKAKKTRAGKFSRVRQEHSHSVWKKTLFLTGLAVLLVISFGIIITLGQVPMKISDVYCTLANRFCPGLFEIDDLINHVILKIRLPLILGAVIAGAGLGVCGCVMQAVLKNPMASPFTLGISSGAHFGVSIAAVFGITILDGPYFLVVNAFLCALLCSGFIISLSAFRGATSETMILAGIAVNYLFQGTNQFFNYIADDEQRDIMSLWGMGSLADINWNGIMFLGTVSLICIPIIFSRAWDLNLMTAGDESAKSMGVNAGFVRIMTMTVASLLVAAIVSFVGVIGFAGLIAPHIGRLILGNDHRYLIPASGGIGAAILLIANAISMNILGSAVLPTGIIMSMIGVPLFLSLILKGKRKEYWS
ncbi:MAG: iron ABC transporter permease [Desulfobacteraceae bacterium]